ncbi:uncharacterized aarF domain-containing protein kinase 2-like isoform X1 [Schistocerca serialis cubense]|uniref:uncharacterized aarF domain-containing protein kinase 2-like isoform X1 n=1 Tax=Schistocerca serialis cubense TaxID=2023355 RepID=UPI00214F5D5A|nr:uncharacterized aarF domain-containing protein kinase 2-like isoform X1 [Schistocerca serialis cubense]
MCKGYVGKVTMFNLVQTVCVILPRHRTTGKLWLDVGSRFRWIFLNDSKNVRSRNGCIIGYRRKPNIYQNSRALCTFGRFCATVAFPVVLAKSTMMENQMFKQLPGAVIDSSETALSRTWIFVRLIFRVFHLFVIFTPFVFLTPLLYMGERCRECWFKLFVNGIEISGPVMVKLGQWASTRRDLFSEEFCFHMSKLQRRTRPHSWHHTEKTLQKAYGPAWNQVILKINTEPIGSGCCAQVYKAYIRQNLIHSSQMQDGGMPDDDLLPVAVKVVHPNMNELLRRDLTILRAAAISITWLFPSLKWLSLEECMNDFTHLMSAQVDMTVEAHNLERFAKNFATTPTVKFPVPIWNLTQSDILVETFEQGEPLLNYVTGDNTNGIKTLLAEIGINTILKMVFDDNFAHGDLHPGNMLVQSVASSKETNSVVSLVKRTPYTSFRLVILDCGIVASLDELGKKALRDVFTAVVNGDGRKVAELFLNHSKHGCTDTEGFKQSMDNIVKEALSKTVTLAEIQVSSLMTALFTTMINHKVKLDGSFSSVILAIMVLEGLGRSLDPTTDIVKKARPFLIGAL